MYNIKELPKSIPSKGNQFVLENLEGSLTKNLYNGDFVSIIPNLKIQSKISKYKAYLNGGMDATLDQGTKDLHYKVAYLRHTIVEAPDWFLTADYGYDLFDENILTAVYDKVLEFETAWLSKLWPEKLQKVD